MKPSDRDAETIARMLEDYATVLQRIEYFSLTKERFCDDHSFEGELAYDAVMNPVYRIVEDAIHLSDEVVDGLPEFPWRDIRGFRNFIAHGYAAINRGAAWNVIDRDLPELMDAFRRYAVDHGWDVG